MGIEGIEEMHGHSEPRPDDEVVEEQRREQEGVEPSPPTPAPDTTPPGETPGDPGQLVDPANPVDPSEGSSPPNPGGGNADTENDHPAETLANPEE